MKKITVLVVDDSALVRSLLTEIVNREPDMVCVGAAADPLIARGMIKELNPDVLTLDIEMPRMDGLTFLKILQQHRPIPVIIVSSISTAGSAAAMTALQSGAVEVLAKPTSAYSIGHLADQLPRHIKAAAASRMRRRPAAPAATTDVAGCSAGW